MLLALYFVLIIMKRSLIDFGFSKTVPRKDVKVGATTQSPVSVSDDMQVTEAVSSSKSLNVTGASSKLRGDNKRNNRECVLDVDRS